MTKSNDEQHLERLIEQIAKSVQETTMEVVTTPSIFTIAPADRRRFDPRNLWSQPIRVTLWCTQPGELHPVADASYETTLPKEWFVQALPHLRTTLRLLQLTPIVGGALGGFNTNEITSELKMLAAICKATEDTLQLTGSAGVLAENQLPHRDRYSVERPSDRAVKRLLLKLGEIDSFKPLHKVYAPSGGVEWVCVTHLARYLSSHSPNLEHRGHERVSGERMPQLPAGPPGGTFSSRPDRADPHRSVPERAALSPSVSIAVFEEFRRQVEAAHETVLDETAMLLRMRRSFHSLQTERQAEVVHGAFLVPPAIGARFHRLVNELPEEIQGRIFRLVG